MIPTYQDLLRPLLEVLNKNNILTLGKSTDLMSEIFSLSPEERITKLKKGNQTIIKNRTGWAKFYLEKAGFVITVSKGVYAITDSGKKLLNNHKGNIDLKYLLTIPQFAEFYKSKSTKNKANSKNVAEPNIIEDSVDINTPDEILEEQYGIINQNLADEILQKILDMSPAFFEQLVIFLLEAMGYGHGEVTGRSGDGGIDGIIGEDKLGLDVIHIQAKRWDKGNNVGRKELQSFVGALAGQSGRKGVFITTSSFTKEAMDYNPANVKIARIDGNRLAHLMIEYNVGVSIKTIYELKKLDLDFFEE
ncbi:MAG: restriction endonuclease [Bacteroidales bacterium]|nr:restriction endonuclease [Bacteroidales bacterium]MBD5277208.1 restriction endonuclease [Bacteroides sp.]